MNLIHLLNSKRTENLVKNKTSTLHPDFKNLKSYHNNVFIHPKIIISKHTVLSS